MSDIFGIFHKHFLKGLPNKLRNIKHFWVVFLHFKDPVNEGHILNFYKHFVKHFIYKNFAMNFKISGFAGFTEEFVI